MKKTLPIKTDILARAYLGSAYILGILQSVRKEDLNPWVVGNFLQLCIHQLNPNYIIFNYYVPEARYETSGLIISKVHLPSEIAFDSKQVVNFIKDGINHDEYVIAYLNEYYIPNKAAFQNFHFDHPVLMFGYDAQKEIANIVGYQKSGQYGTDEVSFEDINNATQNKDGCTYLWYLKDAGKTYKFDLDKVKKMLYEFIHSEDTSKKNEHQFWGLDACNEFLNMLSKMKQASRDLDIRGVYLFFEHAKILKELVLYLIEKEIMVNDDSLLEQVDHIIQMTETAMNLTLKFNMTHSNNTYDKLISICRDFLAREKDFISQLLTKI